MTDPQAKPVTNFIFWSVVGIIFLVLGYLFMEIDKVQSVQQVETTTNTSIQVQLSQIQTDILWIKNNLANK